MSCAGLSLIADNRVYTEPMSENTLQTSLSRAVCVCVCVWTYITAVCSILHNIVIDGDTERVVA